MLRLFVILSTVTYLSLRLSHAEASPLTIESLEDGSCWVEMNSESKQVRVVSFREGRTYEYYQSHLMEFEQKVKSRMDVSGAYDIYLHCSSQKVSFYAFFFENETPLCIEMDIPSQLTANSSKSIEIKNMYPQFDTDRGPCQGQAVGELLVDLSKWASSDVEATRSCLSKLSPALVSSYRELGHKGLYQLLLHKDFFYKEKMAKQKLLQEFAEACSQELPSSLISYNSLLQWVGSWLYLKN